jgi:hypothetical protein
VTLAPTPGQLGVWAVITPRNIYTYTTMAKALTIDLSDSTVTTDHPSPAVSSRYGFIRTEEVTNNLLAAGWHQLEDEQAFWMCPRCWARRNGL